MIGKGHGKIYYDNNLTVSKKYIEADLFNILYIIKN
jgi:hypothetical protein